MNKVRRSQTAPGGRPSKSAERSDRADTARAADRHGRRARLSVPRRRATSDPGIPAGQKPPFVRLRRAVEPRRRHVWLLILKSWHLILNSCVRNNALSWSPVTESNRRPSPYHGTQLPRRHLARCHAASRPGHVSGVIKRSEPTRRPLAAAPHHLSRPGAGTPRNCERFSHVTGRPLRPEAKLRSGLPGLRDA